MQENSPAALRRTVADLRNQLAARPAAMPPQLVEVPVVPIEAIADLEHLLDVWQTTGEQLLAAAHDLRAQLEGRHPPEAAPRYRLSTPNTCMPLQMAEATSTCRRRSAPSSPPSLSTAHATPPRSRY